MTCFAVEMEEVAPVVTKPPMAGVKVPLAGMTADVLSEFRQKRETGKQQLTASEQEVRGD